MIRIFPKCRDALAVNQTSKSIGGTTASCILLEVEKLVENLFDVIRCLIG